MVEELAAATQPRRTSVHEDDDMQISGGSSPEEPPAQRRRYTSQQSHTSWRRGPDADERSSYRSSSKHHHHYGRDERAAGDHRRPYQHAHESSRYDRHRYDRDLRQVHALIQHTQTNHNIVDPIEVIHDGRDLDHNHEGTMIIDTMIDVVDHIIVPRLEREHPVASVTIHATVTALVPVLDLAANWKGEWLLSSTALIIWSILACLYYFIHTPHIVSTKKKD
jgi:hypothetical protein